MPRANTTLGLIAFWWAGSRQQPGRARLTITKLPSLAVIDPRRLLPTQLARAEFIFQDFRDCTFLPANEAWRDETRQALDRAMLVDLLGLSEALLEPLALLRLQWSAEPSVHGGKKRTRLKAHTLRGLCNRKAKSKKICGTRLEKSD